jgi:hypothetical protein
LADPFVESVSNTGIFGGGYADDDRLGVVPTLLIGIVLVLGVATLNCVRVWRQEVHTGNRWFVNAAKDLSTRSPINDLPFVFLLQLCALFSLESSEQLLSDGHLLGGLVWLGGPIAFSLLTHALMGAACTYALGAIMRAFVGMFANLVRTALLDVWLSASRNAGAHIYLHHWTKPHHTQSTRVRQIGGRAPPSLS